MTIEGTKKDRKRTILEGKNAKGELGAAQNGIEAISVDGLVLKNMWARNYESNGFFIHAADEEGQHCDGYTMDNLLASGNRSYGLFAKNCLRRQDDQLGRLPPGRLRLLRRRNAVRQEEVERLRRRRPARRSRSGRC